MSKTIESLARGIEVVEALREHSPASLAELHRCTGINKATLLRILHTLQGVGWVYRSLGDSRYRLSFTLTNQMILTDEALQLAELAAPVLHTVYQNHGWPIDIAIREGSVIRIVETTRSLAAFILNRQLMTYTPPFLFSAHGRAYLAFCSDEERREIVALLRAKNDREGRLVRDTPWLSGLLEQTRKRGYGVRESAYFGTTSPSGQLVDAIAVPLLDGGNILGTMSMAWPHKAVGEQEMEGVIYPVLCAAAEQLVGRVRDLG